MLSRRNLRRGGGGGRGSGGVVPTYQSILGSNLIWMSHSQRGIALNTGEVNTWNEQIANNQMFTFFGTPGGASRPFYQPDGILAAGKPAVEGNIAGPKYMIKDSLAGFLLAGARPWCFARGRFRAITAGQVLGGMAGTAGSTAALVISQTATNFQLFTDGAGAAVVGPAADTNLHSFSYGLDGVNHVLTVDGATFTQAFAGGIAADVTRVTFAGYPTNVQALNADYSGYIYLICAAKPSAAQIAAVTALMQSEFP